MAVWCRKRFRHTKELTVSVAAHWPDKMQQSKPPPEAFQGLMRGSISWEETVEEGVTWLDAGVSADVFWWVLRKLGMPPLPTGITAATRELWPKFQALEPWQVGPQWDPAEIGSHPAVPIAYRGRFRWILAPMTPDEQEFYKMHQLQPRRSRLMSPTPHVGDAPVGPGSTVEPVGLKGLIMDDPAPAT
jgi:hypothetical protein